MEYFIVRHDSRLDPIGGDINFPKSLLEGYENAQDYEIGFLKQGRQLGYCSIIELPVFLVSSEVCKILSQYEPKLEYKTVVINDQFTYKQVQFCLLNVPEIDCISDTHSKIERGVIKHLVIDEYKIQGRSMFKIRNSPFPCLAVRVDVAEALLRKSLYGLKIQKLVKVGEMKND